MRSPERIAMQKVVGSSPIIRFTKALEDRAFSCSEGSWAIGVLPWQPDGNSRGNARPLAAKEDVARRASSPHSLRARLSSPLVSVSIRSNFEITWFRIAVEHERDALAARRTAEQAEEADRGDAFDAELRGTMVAVAASAFAVDALHLTINDLLERGLRSSAGGDGRIVETLKIALDLGPRTQDWQRRVPELFERRGSWSTSAGRITHRSRTRPGSRTCRRNRGRSTPTWQEALWTWPWRC
jgi:hypothetical protein